MAKTIQQELIDGHIPLAINVPDENTMREMLNDEICKVCGRPAHKGTPEYAFMQARLDAFLASKQKTTEEERPVEGGEGRVAPGSGLHKALLHPLPLSPPPSLLFPSSLFFLPTIAQGYRVVPL